MVIKRKPRRKATVAASVPPVIKRSRSASKPASNFEGEDFAYFWKDGRIHKIGEPKPGRVVCCFQKIDGMYNESYDKSRDTKMNWGQPVKIQSRSSKGYWDVLTPKGNVQRVVVGCCFPVPKDYGS